MLTFLVCLRELFFVQEESDGLVYSKADVEFGHIDSLCV